MAQLLVAGGEERTSRDPRWASGAGRLLIPGWAVFAAINLVLMFQLPGSETIPFHLIWLSLALVYGLAPWGLRTMVAALAVVTVVTYTALQHHVTAGYIGAEEMSEVPLMAAIFLAMVWHVRRRQDALTEMARLAAVEHDRAEAEQMFVRLVSHEMRTPITVARGYAELVRDAAPNPRTEEDCAIVLDELAKLDRGTRRLATLMSPESPEDLHQVDVDDMLQHALRRWAPTADRQWRVVSTAGAAALDAERLETALDCLLENAVKFTATGDPIELHGRREAEHVVIEVADGGAGIPPADIPHVFDAFHRGGSPTAPGGTGLGLAIVRRIVEARGGTATVASRLGGGTTLTLRLPLRWQRPAPPAVVVEAAAPGRRPAPSPSG